MTDVPVPALLAAIVLLMWPAGRVYAAWTQRRHFVVSRRLELGPAPRLNRALVVAVVLTANVAAFLFMLAGILLVRYATQMVYDAHEPMIFGKISPEAMLNFAVLLTFALCTFQSAVDSYKSSDEKVSDRAVTAGGVAAESRPLLARIARRLPTELALYASTAAVAVVMIFVAAGFVALVAPNIQGIPG